MSFFGQQNTQQQNTGFGGFGSTNNNSTSGGFGQQPATSGAGLFGSTTNTSGGGFGGFGSGGTTGGFGASSNTSPFGQNRASGFGSATTTASSGLFGSGTATAGTSGGFGGFGANNNTSTNNNASGGGLFGAAAKPAFGASSNTTGSGLFGASTSGGGFGSTTSQNTGLFSQPNSTALGANVGECQGTGSTPFTPFTEKEGTGAMTNHFQSISFMAPYKSFSAEELRLADYNQGRRFGNASGQAGAFGTTNFGGFNSGSTTGGFGQPANTGTGLFGSSSTSAPFGQAQPATSGGFGTSTGGGIFGAAKPATGGIFGGTNTASSAPASGSVFGTSGTNTGGFGSGGGGFGSSGTGLFGSGNNAQNQQPKPSPFGTTTSAAGPGGFGSTTGFGASNNTNSVGGLFGSNPAPSTSSPFGGAQQQQPAQNSNPFGGFGGSNTQNNTGSGFGNNNTNNAGGGIFGNAQPAANSGGGLFGGQNNNPQQSSGGIFGNTGTNNQQSGGLFGAKPAPAAGGLFGNSNTSTGGGLFGSGGFGNQNNNQPQQNQGSSLFGNNNNQQKPGGLFGNTGGNAGSSVFGNPSSNNQQAGGLFGSQNQQPQQQQTSSLFGGNNSTQSSTLFGGSQQQPAQPNAFQQPQTFQASILDANAFGSPSIFGGLPPPPQVSGPIATPISSKKQVQKSTIVPNYRLSSNAASRYQTPPRRGGFGFSYSNYGTPGSASSNLSTPGGFNSSLYSSVGRGLGKSLSTSNLRRNYDDADNILTPGAFSAGSSRFGGSSNMKRLTIDRSLRTDLFSAGKDTPPALSSPEKERQPSILKKKVSFDASTIGGGNGGQRGALNSVQENDEQGGPTAEQQGFLRSPRTPGRAKSTPQPEVEEVRGNELAIVHEDASPDAPTTNGRTPAAPRSQEDQKPGNYWMKPSKEELQKLSKDQRTSVQGFSVGREGCGYVEFGMPVDLTLTKQLDDLYGNVVRIELRSITVYPDQSKKPAIGKGLNVPSTLYLENSWPRQKDRKTPLYETSGPRFQKHVDRLRKVSGTEFVRYEKDTGIWVLKVPHFTTYGFEYDDDENMSVLSENGDFQSSLLSETPPTPTPKARGLKSGPTPKTKDLAERSVALTSVDLQVATHPHRSSLQSSPEDTFQFRRNKFVPGSFDEEGIADDDQGQDVEMDEHPHDEQSFLDQRLVLSSDDDEDEPSNDQVMNGTEDQSLVMHNGDVDAESDDAELEMAGAFPNELEVAKSMITPGKVTLNVTGDWAHELQSFISPKKQDRQILRETQAKFEQTSGSDEETIPQQRVKGSFGKESSMETHMDLMDSLWGQEQLRRSGRQGQRLAKSNGVKLPHSKKPRTDGDAVDLPEQICLLHDNFKPRWGPESSLMYSIPGKTSRSQDTNSDGFVQPLKSTLRSKGGDIRCARIGAASRLTFDPLKLQRASSKVIIDTGVPVMRTFKTPFADFAAAYGSAYAYEETVWTLASILFDDQDSALHGIPASQAAAYDYRIRKDRLIEFWSRLCLPAATEGLKAAKSCEESALQHLSVNQVVEACKTLVHGKDYHLATLISQIGDGDQVVRDDMETQIDTWRDLNSLSEMTEPIRALYALTAGRTCNVEGKKGPAEDRAATFAISRRFSLDWKRAFGLRLYYALLATEPIEVAIKAFAEDLQSKAEPVKPIRTTMNPDGTTQEVEGEDLLWGLLQLYAASKDWLPFPSLGNMLARQSMSSHDSFNTLLSFQLYHALALRFPNSTDAFAADSLAIDFAQQLECAGEWQWSLFATLHITEVAQRQRAIQALLSFHIENIEGDDDNPRFRSLVEECKIPKAWIWRAKAQAARAITQNYIEEAMCLIKADDLGEAHDVLRHTVGPRCVIAEEWTVLGNLLEGFKGGKENIGDWELGGQVYEDYLALIQNRVSGNAKVAVLGRLTETLSKLTKNQRKGTGSQDISLDNERFEEMVALKVISEEVAEQVMTMEDGPWTKRVEAQRPKVFRLPIAKEQHFKGTMELAERYFRGVLAGN